jgi:TP901 family phage tail tape measure protein
MGVFTDIVNVIVNVNGEKSGKSLKELKKDARQLRRELDNLIPGTEEFKKKMEELKRVEARLRAVQNEIRGVGGAFSKIKDEIRQFGILAASYMGFEFITDSVKNLITKNAQLSDEIADIQKSTGMSQKEAENLNKELAKIDTRTSTSELRKMAAAAGQIGVAAADIKAFTVATDKLVVALGDEFSGGAEEVTKNIGALRNVFTDIKSDKIDEDMLRIGNALNTLGAEGFATAPVVTDFASRIGGVAIPLGLSTDQVLGLSAAMQEMNITAEVGGTAVGKILQKMTTHTAAFAEIAGANVEEFSNKVNTDLYGAFIDVVKGARESGTSATKLGKILEDLQLSGAGASQVFLKLGSNTELLKEKVDLSKNALKETDSVMAEFNTKNQTFGAVIDKLGKKMTDYFSNSSMADGLKSVATWMYKILETPLEDKIKAETEEFRKSYVQLLDNNLAGKDRVSVILDLQSKYPEYLKNIDAETVSNKELYAALDQVNEMLVNKLVLVKYQEEVQKTAEAAADAKTKQLKQESALLDFAYKAHEKYGFQLLENASAYEQFAAANKYMQEHVERNKDNWGKAPAYMKEMNDLARQGNYLRYSQYDALGASAEAQNEYNNALKEYQNIEKQLTGSKPEDLGVVKTAKTLQEELDNVNQLLADLDRVYRRRFADSSGSEAEINKISKEKAAERVMLEKEKARLIVEIAKEGEAKKATVVDDAAQKSLERLREQIAREEEAFALSQMESRERELAEINIKFGKMAALAKAGSEEMKRIEALRNAEILALNKKFAEEDEKIEKNKLAKKAELQEQVRIMLLSEKERELFLLMQKQDEINEQMTAAGLDNSVLLEQQRQEIFDLVKKWNDKEVEAEEQKNQAIKRKEEEALRNRLASVDAQAAVASSLASAFTSMFDLLGNESASYVKFQKRLALIQIGIDTASAIAKLVVMSQSNPLNAVTGGIAGIAQYAAGFAQIMGNIAKARQIWEESGEVPEYGFGGILPGPSHADGGMGVYSNGRKVAEIEGYEAMIPRDTTANNPEVIAALLRARGRRIDALSYMPAPISYTSATSAVRYNNAQATTAPAFARASTTATSGSVGMNDVYALLARLSKQLDDGITAKMIYDQYTRDNSAVDFAKKSAQLVSK